jgi:hypothetical protein
VDIAVSPPTVTRIGPVPLPAFGTTTVSVVTVADVTNAKALLSNTELLFAEGLKFVPVIVTIAPGLACVGENELILGIGD